MRERERETETETETERDRERQRERDRETDRETDRQTDRQSSSELALCFDVEKIWEKLAWLHLFIFSNIRTKRTHFLRQ